MKNQTKTKKEQKILAASEAIFSELGFRNAKMDEIAKEASITKVTLYSYFKSKENLYLAVTHKALMLLIDDYYKTIDEYKSKSGLVSSLALVHCFMDFCESNYLYSEALMDYFAMVRSTSDGRDQNKLTDAIKESIYYLKLQDVHNLVFKLCAQEIKRGQEDGSIKNLSDPMLLTLVAWSDAIGYIKLVAANGNNATPIFRVSLNELKEIKIKLYRQLLVSI